MSKEKEFAKELNSLIQRYLDMGCEPQDMVEELTRGHCQTNLSGPAKVAGLKRSGRQLTPLG